MEEDKARKWRKIRRIQNEKIRGFTYKNSANDMVENSVFIAVENRAQYQKWKTVIAEKEENFERETMKEMEGTDG